VPAVPPRPAFLRLALAALGATLLLTVGAVAAVADTGPSGTSDYTRQATPIAAPPQRPPAPPAVQPAVAAPTARWLPVTGADLTGLAVLASVLLVSGVALTRFQRRRLS